MSAPLDTAARGGPDLIDSSYSWFRLVVSVMIGTIGGVGMWSYVVALRAVQSDFGVERGEASLPFTLGMIGFALGGVLMGRLADRFGVVVPLLCGIGALGLGYVGAALAPNLIWFAAAHLLIGAGSSTTLGPLMADVSHWFVRRRGIAVAVCSAGNYVAGTVWPPFVQHFITGEGWRATHVGIAVFCVVTMLPLALMLRRRAPAYEVRAASAAVARAQNALGISPRALMILLSIAGLACCVAMAMPQFHIAAYCGDLGYGPARGAEMVALMMGFGIVSRVASGFIADRIGGMSTLLLSSVLQGVALLLYMAFDGLVSLYVISALFGLFQGGLTPMYAVVIRDYFSPKEAGTRLGVVLMATLFGMALGGWMSGVIFDVTGSYRAAFFNGLLWNLLNVAIVLWLLARPGRRAAAATA